MKGTSEAGRLSHLSRVVQLINDLLEGKEHDRRSVADKLRIQLAAADRQLKVLEKLRGVHIQRRGRQRLFSFDRTSLPEAPKLSTVIAACFGASLAPLFAGTAYETAFREARDLILRQFRRSGSFPNIDRKFVFLSQGGEVSLPDESGQLDDLIDAVLHEKWVTFDYLGFDNKSSHRSVKPLSLLVYNHQLYLMGQSEDGALRAFRFSRIKGADVSASRFEYPGRMEYDPEQVFASCFGVFKRANAPVQKVEIRLSPRWATYVRTHRWHRSQQASFSDGEIRVTLIVQLSPEVEDWVLGFGEDAEVLAPPELRETIARKVRAMARLYENLEVETASPPVPDEKIRPPSPRARKKT